jgi:hypothetical protein
MPQKTSRGPGLSRFRLEMRIGDVRPALNRWCSCGAGWLFELALCSGFDIMGFGLRLEPRFGVAHRRNACRCGPVSCPCYGGTLPAWIRWRIDFTFGLRL